MRNVLLVGEDIQLLKNLKRMISPYFDVIQLASFYEGEAHTQLCSPFADVVCVDVDSIMGFSFEYFEKLSQNGSKKLLFLTSFSDLEKLQHFLAIPNSDYVLKPYHPSEVIVRLGKLLEQPVPMIQAMMPPALTEVVPGLLLDEKGAALLVDGNRKQLPKILRVFFEVLLKNRNTIVSHEYLNEKIWGDYEDMGVHREIRAHAKRLRSLMGRYASLLVNVKAQGYMLSIDEARFQ